MAKLEYDESGSTFTYFLVLVYGLFLLILTYFVWPRELKGEPLMKYQSILWSEVGLYLEQQHYCLFSVLIHLGQDKNKHVCQCGPCCRKRTKLETRRPLERIFKYLRYYISDIMSEKPDNVYFLIKDTFVSIILGATFSTNILGIDTRTGVCRVGSL